MFSKPWLTQYPPDVMVLYAEGYSVVEFLVGQSNRKVFLAFIAQGMRDGWDPAVQAHYGYRSVEELEEAWTQASLDLMLAADHTVVGAR